MTELLFSYLIVVSVLHFISSIESSQSSFSNIVNIVESGPLPHQEFVIPKIYHSKKKTELLTTREKAGIHSDQIQIVLSLPGGNKILDLQLNDELVPEHFLYIHQENGEQKVVEPGVEEMDFCHYVGQIQGIPESWVALSTCDGVNGILYENFRFFEIEKYNSSGYHIFSENAPSYHNMTNDMMIPSNDNILNKRNKRSDVADLDRHTNLPNYLKLVITMDYGVYIKLGASKSNCTKFATSVANIVNRLYSQVNISVALVAVDIWSENDKIVLEPNKTLTNYLNYCKTTLVHIRPYDSAQLISYTNTAMGAVGVGYVGTICSSQSVGVNDYKDTLKVAKTITHEVGHNLGLAHDDEDEARVCSCPGNDCIMFGVDRGSNSFSNCSIQTIIDNNKRGKYYCLKNLPKNKPNTPLIYATCGNKIVEEGEECDCGNEITCQNRCCNTTTCMFTENSKCAEGDCCDIETCNVKSRATTCRPADNECDLPEYCDGTTSLCPPDMYKLETEKCASGKSYCFHGMCLASDAVKVIPYSTMEYSEFGECYATDVNKINYNFDCDNMFDSTLFYTKGKWITLYGCKDINYEKLKFNSKTYVLMTRTFRNNDIFVACHMVMTSNDNIQPNISLCDVNAQISCTTITKIRKKIPTCPQDCHYNGWCNNKGECHYTDIYEPPNCYYLGYGGSFTSGYSRNPYPFIVSRNVLLTFFVGIVPLTSIIACCIHFKIRPKLNLRQRSLRVGGYVERFVRNVSKRFASPSMANNINRSKLLHPVESATSANESDSNCIDDFMKPVGHTISSITPNLKEPSAPDLNTYINVNIQMWNQCQDIYDIPKPNHLNMSQNITSTPIYDVVKSNRPVTGYLESNSGQQSAIYDNLERSFGKQIVEKPNVQPKPILPKIHLHNVKPVTEQPKDNQQTATIKHLERSFGKESVQKRNVQPKSIFSKMNLQKSGKNLKESNKSIDSKDNSTSQKPGIQPKPIVSKVNAKHDKPLKILKNPDVSKMGTTPQKNNEKEIIKPNPTIKKKPVMTKENRTVSNSSDVKSNSDDKIPSVKDMIKQLNAK